MRNKKIVSLILIFMIFSYILMALMPCFELKVYAADQAAGTLSRDINGIDDKLYPGYKKLINDLKQKHPEYTFLVYYTGMDWETVINVEYQGHGKSPKNLVQLNDNYNGLWICPICGIQKFDNGSWCCASKDALEYMMDPRNSINESDVFQFKNLEGSDVTYEDIARVVAKYGSYINNDEVINAIVEASNTYNINGYFLVSKIINEHGKDGSTLSNGQGYKGNYVGYYNYFNIGSFGNGEATIINNGLSRAKKEGWNTRRLSILGGAKVVRESYITEYSQNTLYYQKYNVSGRSTIGSHQYQQNIMAAQSQGEDLKEYYDGTTSVKEYEFIIPLYKNMSSKVSVRPDVTKENKVTYQDAVVKNISKTLTVRATPGLSGMAIGKIDNGEGLKVLLRMPEPIDGYYWDMIVTNATGMYGYAARNVNGESIGIVGGHTVTQGSVSKNPPKEENTNTNTNTNTTINGNTTTNNNTVGGNTVLVPEKEEIKISEDGKFIEMTPITEIEFLNKEYEDKKVTVKDSKGTEITEGKLGTGYKVTIEDKTYTVVKKGDVNGDANINIADVINVFDFLKGDTDLKGEFEQAALVKSEKIINISDVIKLFDYLKGDTSIGL